MTEALRVCRACQVETPLSMFSLYRGRKGFLRRKTCKSCRALHESARYRNDPGVAERVKKSAKRSALKRSYGLTEEDYDKLYASQNGICKICQNYFPKLNIDHCHKTGKIRGLLCWNCNTALGKFKDSVELLSNAISYLGTNT